MSNTATPPDLDALVAQCKEALERAPKIVRFDPYQGDGVPLTHEVTRAAGHFYYSEDRRVSILGTAACESLVTLVNNFPRFVEAWEQMERTLRETEMQARTAGVAAAGSIHCVTELEHLRQQLTKERDDARAEGERQREALQGIDGLATIGIAVGSDKEWRIRLQEIRDIARRQALGATPTEEP